MFPGVRSSLPEGLFVPHELVRVLGKRPNPLYVVRQAAIAAGGRPTLAVAERFAGTAKVDPDGEELAHDARRIATLASPNLARVREVITRGDDVVVYGEFVEGEKLQEMWRPDKLPLEIALRLIVDSLAGVGALHTLRDAQRQPMKLAHGELSPATIVLGLDGLARVLCAVSRRAPGVEAEVASRAYLAPEVACEEPYDARADVFGAGVLLWEVLSGQRLFSDPNPVANARRVRAEALPPPTVPEKAAWAKGLVSVAVKALAAVPEDRWPTAAIMAAELRRAAGLKLAPASTAAAFAKSAFGERVKTRRESLEGGTTPAPVAVAKPLATPVPPPPPRTPSRPAPARVAPSPPALSRSTGSPPALSRSTASPPARSQPTPPLAPSLQPPSPSRAPSPPSEPSFVDVELDSALDGVPVVAPATTEPPEAVDLELGPDSLVDAPPSVVTVAVSPVAVSPVVEPPAVRVEPFASAAPIEATAEERTAPGVARRRRRSVWLAGGAALGVVLFVLAAMHIARRQPDAAPALARPAATASTEERLPPVTSAAAPQPEMAPTPPSPAPSATPALPVETPPAAKAAPSAVEAPTPPPAATEARPPVVATAMPPSPRAVQAPAAVKPRPKPTFDPNSL